MESARLITEGYDEHITVQTKRWQEALSAEGFDAAVIHAGSSMVSFLDDHEYPFRANRHFLVWLPLQHHHDSVLIIEPGKQPVLYYYQPVDYWYLPPEDPAEWWSKHFDVRRVTSMDVWQQHSLPENTVAIGNAPSLAQNFEAAQINPERLINRLHLDRTRKTQYEVNCISEANRIAAYGHRAAENAFYGGKNEMQIHQAYCAACSHSDDDLPYGNIVALNGHTAVLHYQHRDKTLPADVHSFLIDAGTTVQGYVSDITRTYAKDTTNEFHDLIQAMDEVQLKLVDGVGPGVDYKQLHLDAHRLIAGILKDFGVINISAESAVEQGVSSIFYPHGLGHYLGLQTHDVAGLIADADGTPIPRPEGHPYLRLTRVLEAGNVLTIEPGLYFIEPLLKQLQATDQVSTVNWDRIEQFRPYGGIRIEDNILVTAEGRDNLSRPAFAGLA